MDFLVSSENSPSVARADVLVHACGVTKVNTLEVQVPVSYPLEIFLDFGRIRA